MKSALLVIDFINDIVHPAGKIATAADYIENHRVLEKANIAIKTARAKKAPVIHVKVGFSSNYIECPLHSPLFGKTKENNALQLGQWGTEFHTDIDVKPTDVIMVKHRVSALYATPLEAILKANHIDTVLISGVSTNMAIETITRELHDRDYRVVVIQDACGASSREIHDASINTLQRLAIICNADELEKMIA